MNTFITAMPMVPLVRYEDRYSRAIGKWMLNAANAARLFYADEHTPQTQSPRSGPAIRNSSVAYEGLRHHWLNEYDGEEQYAAGDPLTYGWGPQTDFGVYGSAVSGVFGSIIKTTNVDKILQLDLLATDTYHDPAHSTYLVLQPAMLRRKSVSINLGNWPASSICTMPCRINTWPAAHRAQTFFNVPADEAVQLVLVPSGGMETRQGRQLARRRRGRSTTTRPCLPDNMLRNPDVDTALPNDANHPAFLALQPDATWSSQTALSPTHSLGVVDNNPTGSEEWRSYSTTADAGTESHAQAALVLEIRHLRRRRVPRTPATVERSRHRRST